MAKVFTDPDGRHYVLRAWITIHGQRIYASSKGKRCFKIYVD